jgi:hypothetical protein
MIISSMPPGFRSDETSAMVMGGMAAMQGQASYAQGITPQNFGAPIQPMTAPQPTQSPFATAANAASQIWGGYGAVTGQMPGSMGQQQAMDQMQMSAMGLIAGPSTPFPVNQMFTGMQQQAVLNRTLEQNFQQVRPGGRGFTGTQQLAVGAGLNQLATQTPFVGMGEITQLMGQGAQLGQYQGMKDATQVIKRTRELLKDWRDIAVELNTTMSEAQQIMGQVKQLGVFRPGQQKQMIQGMATTAAMTGIGVQQQMQMGAVGAQLAPQYFGQGVGVRQAGAAAMQSQLQMIGVAQKAGVVSEEQIFEATGQTGAQGQMAFAQKMNLQSAKFMKKGRGKVTLAAFVDPDTMQIDQNMVQKFMSGNMNLGEIERRAGQNASKMGYVRWRANQGRMAAAFTEETAGLGHLALMRSFMGEGVMEDTERSRLILARHTGMSQADVDAAMPMLRELPMLQNRMRNETRMVSKQRQQAQQWNQYGPQAQMERQKEKLRQAVLGPIDQLRQGIQQAFVQSFEEAINEATGENEQAVSQATQNLMGTMIRGGVGSQQATARYERARGLTTGDLRAFQKGSGKLLDMQESMRGPGVLAQLGAAFKGGAGGNFKYAGPGGMLGGGLGGMIKAGREMGIGKLWRGGMGEITDKAQGLVGKLGDYLAGKSVEEMQRNMPTAGSDVLAKAYNTGVFGPDAMKELFPDGKGTSEFEGWTKDDRVGQAIVMGTDYADKLDRVKKLTGYDDEKARAVLAKVSNTSDVLAKIDFLSPSGKSEGTIRTAKDAMKAYIKYGAGAEEGRYRAEIEANASSWVNDSKLQKMVAEGKSLTEISLQAEKVGGKAAAAFMQQQLGGTVMDEAGNPRQMSAEEKAAARARFGTAGDVQLLMESRGAIQKAYMSQAEDVAKAMEEGTYQEAMKGAAGTKRAGLVAGLASAFGKYGLTGKGATEKDLAAFRDEVQEINTQMLSQSPGDISATVALMRSAGMGSSANQLEIAAGIQQDIRKGSIGQAREKGVRMLLGRSAAGFEDLLSQKGAKKFEKIALRMADEGFGQDEIDKVMAMAKAGKDDITKFVDEKTAQVALYEENKQKDEAAQKEEMGRLKKDSMEATKRMEANVKRIADNSRTPKQVSDDINKMILAIGKDAQEKTNADTIGDGT